MTEWFAEVRGAVRGLARRPGFTAITVATLALGIGATTTILSVVDGVMLRPLPYENPEELVAVGVLFPDREWVEGVHDLQYLAGVSLKNFEDLRDRSRTLEGLAGVERANLLIPDEGDGPRVEPIARVTRDFFSVLGVDAERGRLFSADEYGVGRAETPIVLGWRTWQERFGGDPDVIGEPLPQPEQVAGGTVVGVLPRGFVPPESLGLADVEYWQPIAMDHPRYESRGSRSLDLVARLADGVSVEAARTELVALAADIARDYPDGNVGADGRWFGYGVNGLREELVGTTRRPLGIFLGAALLLLAISAMNTANLLLVRGMDRTGELSVRRALGAGRGTIVRQLLTESVLLSVVGGLIGAALSVLGVKAFLALSPEVPRMSTISVDGRILAFTAAVSIGAGILTGLVPGLGLGGRELATGIRRSTAGSGGGFGRVRDGLVALQLAMALVLAIGASVLMHSFVNVTSTDPGIEVDGVTVFRLSTKRPGAASESWAAWDETLAAVRPVTGVESAAGATNLPFEDPNWAPGIRFAGETEAESHVGIAGYAVTPNYFETMRQTLVSGRGFELTDGPDAEAVAVVNQALVDRDFVGRNPIGETVRLGEDPDPTVVRIVGVVANAVVERAEDGPRPALYIPYTQVDWPWIQVVVRSDRDATELISDLRRAVAGISPIVPMQGVGVLRDRVRTMEAGPRFQAFLIATFALAALLLAAIGLYGSLAWAVGRRRREMGVRMALGADPERIVSLVFRQGIGVAGVGVVLGLGAAVLLRRVLERFLFDVPALDPVGFGVATGVLLLAVTAAILRPALRASRVDLVRSLRME